MKNKDYSKLINILIIILIAGFIVGGVGLILASIWSEPTAQSILSGLGSGLITSAIITILFELRSWNERKRNSSKISYTLLQELNNILSLFVFYLYFFIDETDAEKNYTDFLQSKRDQINKFLKIKIEQNKEATDFKLLYDHISIATCERKEIQKSIDRIHEISAIYLSTQAINDMQFNALNSLHYDYYLIMEGMESRGNLAITAFCFFLDDMVNLLTQFKELEFYNRLIFSGGEKKGIIIKNKEKLTDQQIRCLNVATANEGVNNG